MAAKAKIQKRPAKNLVKKGARKMKTQVKAVAKPKVEMAKAASPRQAAAPAKAAHTKAAHTKAAQLSLSAFITPLDDRLVVSPDEAPGHTAGGLIIPGSVATRPSRGTVLARGRGRRNKKGMLRPLDVKVGDQVLFADVSGSKIAFEGQEFLILREADVLGVVI